ncbi:MAG: hypothetical protein BMS9Abin02_0664 [Anaerolineae bacterium]|nr:MAG: hypothetical protein BMS9Abin02_0664 [Anaerolineae bacterium]
MAEPGEPISERELSVLERLVDGSTNREIARDLDISPNTVKVHLRNVFTKLEVSSRTEAVTVALQQGILSDLADGGGAGNQHTEGVEELSEKEDMASNEGVISSVLKLNHATRFWRILTITLVAVIALLLVILIRSGLNSQGNRSETSSGLDEEIMTEEPIGDTNWLKARSLLGARGNMAVVTIGLDLYQIGGEVEAGIVSLVDVFDTNNHEWRSAASKPTAVTDATAAVLFGEIYVPGGRLADENPTSVVEVYSPANDAWRQITPLPKPLAGALALTDGGLLYVFGGWDGQEFVADSYVYDPGTDEWQELPPMKSARANAAGAALVNQLFIVGGFDGTGELNSCEYYDIAEAGWFSCAPMEEERAGAGAAILGNKLIYVLGGGLDSSVVNGEVYDVENDSWQTVVMPMLKDNLSWTDLGVTSVEARIYALGGRQNGELVDFNYIYAPLIHRTFLPAVGDDR